MQADPPASDVQVITGSHGFCGYFCAQNKLSLEEDGHDHGGLCLRRDRGAGTERTLAWELLALALERELGLPQMPRSPGTGGETLLAGLSGPLLQQHQPQRGGRLRSWTGCRWEWTWSCCVGPRAAGGDLEDEAFFRMWTAQESTVKRRGLGIGALVGETGADPCAGLWRVFCPDMWSGLSPPGRPGSGPFSSRT